MKEATLIAALYVEMDGCYSGLAGVDAWDVTRDARGYAGPWPVVAHPPCQRWGRFWHGSTRKPHQFKLGDDGGCFAAALNAVRTWGGVLEHPADSHAWRHFDAAGTPRRVAERWRYDRLDLLRRAGALRAHEPQADVALRGACRAAGA